MKNKFNWVYGVLIAIIVVLFLILMTVINSQQKLSCNQIDGRNGCESVGAQHYSFNVFPNSTQQAGVQWSNCEMEFDKKYNVSDMSQNGFCTLSWVSSSAVPLNSGSALGYINEFSCDCWYLN